LGRYTGLDDLQLEDRLASKREYVDRLSSQSARLRRKLEFTYSGEDPNHSGRRITHWDRLNSDHELVKLGERMADCRRDIEGMVAEIERRKSKASPPQARRDGIKSSDIPIVLATVSDWVTRVEPRMQVDPSVARIEISWSFGRERYKAFFAPRNSKLQVWIEVPQQTDNARKFGASYYLPADDVGQLAYARSLLDRSHQA
jgi:hypothetical protein